MWDLAFRKNGDLTGRTVQEFVDGVAAEDVDDLFVFSHGWGTSESMARELYDDMFPRIAAAAAGRNGTGTVGFAGIFWPSLWFPDTPATPPPRGGSAQADGVVETQACSGVGDLSGMEIADALRPGFDEAAHATLDELGQLIDDMSSDGTGVPDDVQEQRLVRFNTLLQTLVPASGAREDEDAGETVLLSTTTPKADYQRVAEVFGSVPPGSAAQGMGDWIGKVINGAKDALRVLSYTVMKARAGDIGRTGLGPLLAALRVRRAAVRVHLIGHSFGARLVSFALAGVGSPEASPVASLLLIQGAFSHFSFSHAQDNPFGTKGALHDLADRVHGPLVATYSEHDWAVRFWYPKASLLARQDEQDQEDASVSRWGGMGADGFQAVTPAAERMVLTTNGTTHAFTPANFYRVDASNVINNVHGQPFAGAHSDIRKPAVAGLAAAAAGRTHVESTGRVNSP